MDEYLKPVLHLDLSNISTPRGNTVMRLVVCDDVQADLEAVVALLDEYYRRNADIATYTSPEETLFRFQNGEEADIAILDILMPGLSGDRLATALREARFEGFLIFLTASNDFAAESYEVSAFSYLLKPVNREALFEVLRRIDERRTPPRDFLAKWKGGSRNIPFSDLIYAEVKGHTLFLHLTGGETLRLYAALRDFEGLFEAEPSMERTHKSFYVNMTYVVSLKKRSAALKNGETIPISRSFIGFEKRYFDWLLKERDPGCTGSP